MHSFDAVEEGVSCTRSRVEDRRSRPRARKRRARRRGLQAVACPDAGERDREHVEPDAPRRGLSSSTAPHAGPPTWRSVTSEERGRPRRHLATHAPDASGAFRDAQDEGTSSTSRLGASAREVGAWRPTRVHPETMNEKECAIVERRYSRDWTKSRTCCRMHGRAPVARRSVRPVTMTMHTTTDERHPGTPASMDRGHPARRARFDRTRVSCETYVLFRPSMGVA